MIVDLLAVFLIVFLVIKFFSLLFGLLILGAGLLFMLFFGLISYEKFGEIGVVFALIYLLLILLRSATKSK